MAGWVSDNFEESLSQLKDNDPDLTESELTSSGLTDEDIEKLVESLESNTVLEELRLKGNKFSDRAVALLSKVLSKNMPPLKLLNLSYNGLTDEGMKSLGACLAVNTTLTGLYISNNKITSAGLSHLCAGLSSNPSLTKLNLEGNQIVDLQPLTAALATNTSLQSLVLNSNEITDAGVQGLDRVLQTNIDLEDLDLAYNLLTDATAEQLDREAKYLKWLHLDHNKTALPYLLRERKPAPRRRRLRKK